MLCCGNPGILKIENIVDHHSIFVLCFMRDKFDQSSSLKDKIMAHIFGTVVRRCAPVRTHTKQYLAANSPFNLHSCIFNLVREEGACVLPCLFMPYDLLTHTNISCVSAVYLYVGRFLLVFQESEVGESCSLIL